MLEALLTLTASIARKRTGVVEEEWGMLNSACCNGVVAQAIEEQFAVSWSLSGSSSQCSSESDEDEDGHVGVVTGSVWSCKKGSGGCKGNCEQRKASGRSSVTLVAVGRRSLQRETPKGPRVAVARAEVRQRRGSPRRRDGRRTQACKEEEGGRCSRVAYECRASVRLSQLKTFAATVGMELSNAAAKKKAVEKELAEVARTRPRAPFFTTITARSGDSETGGAVEASETLRIHEGEAGREARGGALSAQLFDIFFVGGDGVECSESVSPYAAAEHGGASARCTGTVVLPEAEGETDRDGETVVSDENFNAGAGGEIVFTGGNVSDSAMNGAGGTSAVDTAASPALAFVGVDVGVLSWVDEVCEQAEGWQQQLEEYELQSSIEPDGIFSRLNGRRGEWLEWYGIPMVTVSVMLRWCFWRASTASRLLSPTSWAYWIWL
eukprot:TRINITY_DN75566_c0_g1_i1.p1 TRINITY_DN75566_c0_g1~~TRINITY_DN75566_c0_g1_i1.p1  ORF type:complete len:438 (+),score=77.40 TRINITY_DN75566_c0_g1_i1:151-1464(+)